MSIIRTRFAPSPTGYLHIGGVRTALFNWFFARRHSGKFILRIDDTDVARNLEAALGPILAGFRWLGLDWDEGPEVGGPHGPYFQSERGELYRDAARGLIDQGKAYRCYCTTDEIQAERHAADREKRVFLYSRRCLKLSHAERQRLESEGRRAVVRFLVPRAEKVAIDDHVRGRVEHDAALISDPVILRADGTPLYNFATVVDDTAMQITHVIRAEEHLPNTPIQVLLYRALGHEPPLFAHLPYVAAPGSKEKLSKRKLEHYRKSPAFGKLFDQGRRIFEALRLAEGQSLNPVMLEFYERAGYLPRAMINYLARLGWSLDDTTEIIPPEEIVRHFSLDRVVKAPAAFDPDKLLWVQSEYMNALPVGEKAAGCLPFLLQGGAVADPPSEPQCEMLVRLVEAAGDRIKVFGDILDYTDFFLPDDRLPYDEAAFDKRLRRPPEAADLLRKFRDRLAAAEPFDPPALEKLMADFVEAEGIQVGQIIHAARVAVTGKAVGFGLFETLAILGKDRCLARIDRALGRL